MIASAEYFIVNNVLQRSLGNFQCSFRKVSFVAIFAAIVDLAVLQSPVGNEQ